LPRHQGAPARAWFVEDDGERHCLGTKATPEIEALADRRVLATVEPSEVPDRCDEPVARIQKRVSNEGGTAEGIPLLRSIEEVMARRLRWGEVVGAFTWLEPPFGGGYAWHGRFRLGGDGAVVPVDSVPMPYVESFRAPDVVVTGLAHLGPNGELNFVVVCKGVVERCGLPSR
jgi:hypothetical protein